MPDLIRDRERIGRQQTLRRFGVAAFNATDGITLSRAELEVLGSLIGEALEGLDKFWETAARRKLTETEKFGPTEGETSLANRA